MGDLIEALRFVGRYGAESEQDAAARRIRERNEAASRIAELEAAWLTAEGQLSEISHAIGTVRFMDPPDGGDVSLAEQVRRMKAALDGSEAKLAKAVGALEPFAKAFWTLSHRWQDHEDHWQSALHRKLNVGELRAAATAYRDASIQERT